MDSREFKELSTEVQAELRMKVCEAFILGGRRKAVELLNCKYQSFSSIAHSMGLNLKELHDKHTDYLYNKSTCFNPFSEESDLKYYLLGFILGDGCLVYKSGKVSCLTLSSSDKELIDQFVKVFPTGTLYLSSKGNYTLSIYDRPICKSLLDLGICQAKSYRGANLKSISNEFYIPFLCGLLDSDGYVRSQRQLSLSWYGHFSYMTYVEAILNELGYHPTIRSHDKSNLVVVSLSSTFESQDLLNKFNSDVHIKFSRKRDKNFDLKRKVLTRVESLDLNERIKENIPRNRTELLTLAKELNITESSLTKRLVRLGLKYNRNYSKCGSYERKHKEERNNV